MMTIQSSPLLRQALVADATTSGAFGLMMLIGAGALSGVFGLPELLLRIVGLVLLPYAAFIGWLGLREEIHRSIAWAVILGNALWVVDSALLLLSGWVAPTSAGYAFVIAQALVVLMYAEFQFVGMRRSEAATA
ncbi:hypothetical protein HPT29_019055 [Microvirga terrae]|uniref:Integral membrane protein n=1 Tax=Microvirga terrae TaxID=2740529 RepID=A0ABY5RNH8_9HYPH|nr:MULTISPECIES: hypothetical protein [Microvirga]MBQ0823168.1 hypothetical protein [Microvirga sp. HBU67558]UVF18568.1 hypothetical protein HPT29_019055 [Microvirga terrae]